MRVDGKTAVITGAASGIGRATAEALAAAGAHVILGDVAVDMGKEAAEGIRAKGGGAEFIRLDVTDLASIDAFRSAITSHRKQVDIVVNVAGWGKIEPFVKNTPDFWRKVIDLNLLGPIAVTRAFLDPMIESKTGKIVTVSSDAGRVGSLGESVYAGAKGGAIAFTKSLAREVAARKITVNAIAPGFVETEILDAMPEGTLEEALKLVPLARTGKPEEIGYAVAYLASDQAAYITGQVLGVDGGMAMM